MKRRQFNQSLLHALAGYALLGSGFRSDAFAAEIKPLLHRWLQDLNQAATDLKSDTLSNVQWQDQVALLFRQITLSELIRLMDFERLIQGFQFPDKGVNTKPIVLPPLAQSGRYQFFSKLFGMARGRAIIPHGHSHMVSCHYVLEGCVHLRQYDKLEESDDEMLIRPSVDEVTGPGSHSSISDDRHNVHWLKALSEHVFTLDIIIVNLRQQRYRISNIDAAAAKPDGQGSLWAPKLDVAAALDKYGADSHH